MFTWAKVRPSTGTELPLHSGDTTYSRPLTSAKVLFLVAFLARKER